MPLGITVSVLVAFLAVAAWMRTSTFAADESPVRDASTSTPTGEGGNPTGSTPPPPSAPKTMVLLGDSIASTMAPALEAEGAARGTTVVPLYRWGCGLTSGVTQKSLDAALSARCAADTPRILDDAAARVGPGDAVIWFSSFEVNDHEVDGRVLRFRTPEWDQWFLGQLTEAEARFSARGAVLVLVTVAPRAPVGGIERQPLADAEDTMRLTEIQRRFASEHPFDVIVADLAAIVCPNAPRCPERIDGIVVRSDSTHYGAEGAAWAAPRLLDLIDVGLISRWRQV